MVLSNLSENLKTVPNLSLKERDRQLHKFEILLLSEETVEEFNQLFADRKLEIQEPLFQSWLILKNASLPTKDQALETTLHLTFPKRKPIAREIFQLDQPDIIHQAQSGKRF
jgi:hypothetical protein